MTHYDERLQKDIDRIKHGVIVIAKAVERGLENALTSLLTLDDDLAYHTIIDDHPINRKVEEVDNLCHYFVARHLPSAGHLRFISSVLRMNVELERIGDYAVNVAREAATIKQPIEDPIRGEIERMGRDSLHMFRHAIAAFAENNAGAARATMKTAKRVDVEFESIYEDLVREGREGSTPIKDLLSKLIVIYMLERVSAQSKNVCEEVVFSLTGETKQRRPVKIIFLDRGNNGPARIATAVGHKAFPNQGRYASAGLKPVAISSTLSTLMGEVGHDLQNADATETVDLATVKWRDFDVIVSLEGSLSDYVPEIPVGTVGFEWKVPPLDVNGDAEHVSASFREVYEDISHRLSELIATMRGLEEEEHA